MSRRRNAKPAPSPPVAPRASRRAWLWLIAVWIVTTILFAKALSYPFIRYDEDQQIVFNDYVHSLSLSNLAAIFTHYSKTSYYPVRLLSFGIDYAIWKLNATGYHLTNLVLHLVNVTLVWWLFRRSYSALCPEKRSEAHRTFGATVAAALFAFHPLVVEPVVWVPGREELLTVFFTLLCVHAHWSACLRGGWPRAGFHVLSALTCAAACMSNVTAAIAPALVLLVDVAVLGRRSVRRVATGTWFLVLIGVATVVVKLRSDAVAVAADKLTPVTHLPVWRHTLHVLAVYGHNLTHLLWPQHLCVAYLDRLPIRFLESDVVTGVVCAVITAIVVWLAWPHRLFRFGILWFLVALLPSAQIVPHHISFADRFLYLPLVGAVIACAALMMSWQQRTRRASMPVIAASLVLAALLVRSAVQVPTWRDSITLFSHCLRLAPNNTPARFRLGCVRVAEGDLEAGIVDLDQVLPELRGTGLETRIRAERGLAHAKLGHYEAAIDDFTRTLALGSDNVDIRFNRGRAYYELGQYARAVDDFRAALQQGGGTDVYYWRALALAKLGQFEAAIDDLSRVLAQSPDDVDAHLYLGRFLTTVKQPARAAKHYKRALELQPDRPDIANELAWLLATTTDPTVRQPARAVALAEQAVRATKRREPHFLDTLAAAYAAAGRIDDAINVAEEATSLARSMGQTALAEQCDARLQQYRSKRSPSTATQDAPQ